MAIGRAAHYCHTIRLRGVLYKPRMKAGRAAHRQLTNQNEEHISVWCAIVVCYRIHSVSKALVILHQLDIRYYGMI